ncbi:MAG: chemotaxis protein CheB [Chroococcus sp. CMT-3BRIN-NPC107]|jgi:two-component system chemotaxis response regulator CheB|nr:chemotaxis protein CheB [Chroococcus sp. CMT-3BRIN-NPC107]
MFGHDIIVVGASAGGVETLCQLVCGLPPDLPAAVFIVLHVPAHGKSVLPKILNRVMAKQHGKLKLQARHPIDGELIQPGHIYVAPPDKHLLIKDSCIHLARGPRENSHRPAVDPLFRTAARTYGTRVVGVVLSGLLDDGTAGLAAIKQCGGITIAQDPEEALYSGMPRSAIENVEVDYIQKVADISKTLAQLASEPVLESKVQVHQQMDMEANIAQFDLNTMQNSQRPGIPSGFACPECRGALWELQDGKLIRFRCRTGHAYSINSLLAEQTDALEVALWSALRALEEKAALTERMATSARTRSQNISAKRFQEQAQDSQQKAALVRQMLLSDSSDDLSAVNGQLLEQNLDNSILSDANQNNLHVVAIASTTDTKALKEVLAALDSFPAAIIVAQQLYPEYPNELVDKLNSCTSLNVKLAEDGDILRVQTVYIAPSSRHLLVNPDGRLTLLQSKLVHFVSPSTDLLFESVAGSFREKAIALILTPTSNDGIMGMRAIRETGGYAIVAQGEENMLQEYLSIAQVIPVTEIAQTLINLATRVE